MWNYTAARVTTFPQPPTEHNDSTRLHWDEQEPHMLALMSGDGVKRLTHYVCALQPFYQRRSVD